MAGFWRRVQAHPWLVLTAFVCLLALSGCTTTAAPVATPASATTVVRPAGEMQATPVVLFPSSTPPSAVDGLAPEETASEAEAPASEFADFQSEMEDYIAKRDGSYGLAVRELSTGDTTLINAERPFPAASTYKLLVMYEVFKQVERGELAMDDTVTIVEEDIAEDEPYGGLELGDEVTVADALERMISVSSNYAAYALVRTAGGWRLIDQSAADIGMAQTAMGSEFFQTTAEDMLLFFDRLARGKLVSERASAEMYAILSRQTVNDRLPAKLPEGVTVAHKTGELPGVRNDVGIVEGPRGRIVVCVLTEAVNEEAATLAIAEIGSRAYERYSR